MTAQWGAVGVLVSVLTAANIFQWRLGRQREERMDTIMDKAADIAIQQTAAIVELVTLVRDRKQ